MTWQEAYKRGTARLQQCGVEEAGADAWILLEEFGKIDRAHYFLRQMEEMPEEARHSYECAIAKRAQRIPVQQITGKQEFCGLEFQVNEKVLIPRQDTECLVEEALKKVKPGDHVLDVCTGSGCIIISIQKLMRDQCVCCATDISKEALKVAEKNAMHLEAKVRFVQGDLMENVTGRYHCIVSNPPYIESEVIRGLEPEVRDHEPMLALDGKEDGLFFYRKIIKEALYYLEPEGWLLFEIGYLQGEAVSTLMIQSGYREVTVKKDLAGLDRIVLGQYRP